MRNLVLPSRLYQYGNHSRSLSPLLQNGNASNIRVRLFTTLKNQHLDWQTCSLRRRRRRRRTCGKSKKRTLYLLPLYLSDSTLQPISPRFQVANSGMEFLSVLCFQKHPMAKSDPQCEGYIARPRKKVSSNWFRKIFIFIWIKLSVRAYHEIRPYLLPDGWKKEVEHPPNSALRSTFLLSSTRTAPETPQIKKHSRLGFEISK